MTKIKIVGAKNARESIEKRVREAIANAKLQNIAADELKREIRSGTNPKTGKNYRQLKESTIRNRRYLARNNPTHPQYSPARSNLTLTGQLIDGIKARFNKASGVLTIFISGKHPGYRGNSGKIKGSSKSRAEIAQALEDQGRPVLNISKRFTQFIVDRIERALRRL